MTTQTGRAVTPTEEQEQRTLAEWLDWHGVVWLHPPNEGKRSRIGGGMLKRIGLSPGAPDILILQPPPDLSYAGVAIEMKRRGRESEKDGGVTPEQRVWLERLRGIGWKAFVSYGADHAIAILDKLGYGA